MQPPDHERLVRDASKGDAGSVSVLLDRHLPGLLAFVRARVGARLREREDALDLVQSACREVLEDIQVRDFGDESGFKRWLYRAAENKIRDKARYHGRERRDAARVRSLDVARDDELATYRRGVAAFFTPSREAMAREELATLERALAELPEDYRQVILLTRVMNLGHATVAEQMGRSETATRSLLHRALARLARLMAEQG